MAAPCPTLRLDGVYQLYVELPYLHYLEVDSNVYDASKTGRPARPWAEVAGNCKQAEERKAARLTEEAAKAEEAGKEEEEAAACAHPDIGT